MCQLVIYGSFRAAHTGLREVIIIEQTFIYRGTLYITVLRIVQHKDIDLIAFLIDSLELPVKMIISPVAVSVIFSVGILHMFHILKLSHDLIHKNSRIPRNFRVLLEEYIEIISFIVSMLIKLHQFLRIAAEYNPAVCSSGFVRNMCLTVRYLHGFCCFFYCRFSIIRSFFGFYRYGFRHYFRIVSCFSD